MATRNEMIAQHAKLVAEAAALGKQIESLPPDDEVKLKEGDWVQVDSQKFTAIATVEIAKPDNDDEIRLRFGGPKGEMNWATASNCTLIPFDVAKLVESMMALPCPDGYEWTGDVRAVDRSKKSGDFVITDEGNVRSSASQERGKPTNSCPRPILRKKA